MEEKSSSSPSDNEMPVVSDGQLARTNNLLVIRFKEISVTVQHTDAAPGYETFGKKLLGCFCGLCLKIMKPKPKPTKIQILKKVSGYIMPGTMTLLLGPPGSGKSTLLKVIEGNLHKDKQLKQDDGVVLYNKNVLTSKIAPTKPIAYITENRNVHLPVLTVRETLEFVQDCMQETHEDRFLLHSAETLPPELSRCKNPYLEYVLRSFGLKEIEHQKVGSIRDGDRIRLAIAEAAVGTHSVMLFDHPSSGQDSLSTHDFLSMLQSVTRLHQAATMIAIPLVAPEFYNLFDRVIILSEGRIIFQGQAQAAENYFKGLGFIKTPQIDTGTFLEDIAAGDGAQYMESGSTLLTADDLAEAYEQSEHYRDVLRIVTEESVVNTFWAEAEPSSIQVSMRETKDGADLLVTQAPAIERSNSMVAGDKVTAVQTNTGEVRYVDGKAEAAKVADLLDKPVTAKRSLSVRVERRLDEDGDKACYRKQFGLSMLRKWCIVTGVLIKRQVRFAIRLKKLLLLRLLQATVVGLFIGTLFYHTGGPLVQSKMNSMRSIGFVSMMHMLLLNIVQLPVHIIVHRPVFYKQRAQHLFGVSSYLVAHGVVNLPQAAAEAFIYSICVYFLANLSRETASHYFQYWAVLFLISYLGSWYMILVSAIAPILEVATVLAGLVVVVNLLFSGFPIILRVMKPWWKWMLYVTPTRWGNVIFSSTQFKDRRYSAPCSAYISFGFCLFDPTVSVGEAFLKFYDLQGKLVLAYSIIVVFTLAVISLAYLAYKKVEAGLAIPPERPAAVMLQDSTVVPHGTELEVAEAGGVPEEKKWATNLSFQSITLTFQDLKLTKKDTRRDEQQRTLLNNVSGYTKPGEMLAIVGNMYSGKKTLFSCISGRVPSGKLEGDVLYNGSKLNTGTLCRISGFVEKESRLQPFLTVKETIEFSANLRLGRQVSASEKAAHVQSIIELIGLSRLSNHLVGNLRQAVSRFDENCKKLKIGVELAANPGILFLEDPTYRFDSNSTRRVLKLLQKVAFGGRTVIITLDHPSGEALAFFDSVLILKLGGEQVYFGPVGWNCSVMLDYFQAMPGVPKYEGNLSPLTYVLDLVGGGIRPRQPVADFAAAFKQSPLYQAMNEDIQFLVLEQQKVDKRVLVDPGYPSAYGTQIAMVFLRNQRVLYRNVLYTFSRLVGSIMVGLLMGTLYLQMSMHRILTMTSVSVLPYMQALLISGLISNNVILQLGTDRAVYKRELRARMYARILYPMSWALAELPYLLLSTLVFLLISNSMAGVGINTITIFLKYWMALFLFSVVITYYGIFITLLSHHPLLAVSLVSITTSVWVGGSGVSVPRYDTRFYKWLYWVDPFQYVVNILTATGFHCDTGSPACRSCKVSVHDCVGCGCDRLRDVEAMMVRLTGSSNRPAVFAWDRLVNTRVIEVQRNRRDYGMLCAMVVVFGCLALVVFTLRNLRRKPRWHR